MLEIHLFDILAFSAQELVEATTSVAGVEVSVQLKSVVIPIQRPAGEAEKFSILALTYPRLTPEDKRDMELVDEVAYDVVCAAVKIKIELDPFKKINWIHIEGSPETFERLMAKIRSVVEAGGNKFEWQR
jgi:hypothetical protein